MALIREHLTGLFRFDGRERRQPFWLWVAIVMGTMMIAWTAVFIPFFIGMFGRIEQFGRDHADQVTRTVGPGSYSIQVNGNHPELIPDIGGLMAGLGVIVAFVIVLLAAAVARRLHDGGKSRWWGVAPLPFLFTGLAIMTRIFAASAAGPDDALPDGFFVLFGLIMVNNLVYLAALITLIVMLCGASADDDGCQVGEPT
jgi:uncharacterized membrane protein YhaH (DUF805 family)